MTDHATVCDSYFRHSHPSFVGYPHLIVYPMETLPDTIAVATGTVPRMWPLPSELLLNPESTEGEGMTGGENGKALCIGNSCEAIVPVATSQLSLAYSAMPA